jgi:two-component system, NtrC family, sensor histidine kinase KinB
MQTIKSKLLLSYFFLIFVTILVTGWAIYNFYQLDKNVSNNVKKNYMNVISVEGLVESMERQNGAQLLIMTKELQQGQKFFYEYKSKFFKVFENLKKLNEADDRGKLLLDSLNMFYDFYLFGTDSLISLVNQKKYLPAQNFYFNTIQPVFQTLREKCFILLEKNQEDMMDVLFSIHNKTNSTIYAVLLASILAIFLGVYVGYRFSKQMVQPIENLTSIVQQIRGGKLDFKIETATGDEIGELTDELKMMTLRLNKYEELNIERIIAEKKKSESIVESITEAIIVTDSSNNIILLNEQAENVFKIKESEVIDKNMYPVIKNKQITNWINDIVIHKDHCGLEDYPYLLFKIENNDRYFRPKLTPMITASQEFLGVVTILQDITRFKELDKLKSDFMATISHEFNTPLTSINMSIDIFKQEILGPLNQKQKELIHSTVEDILRLRKMVKELLELSRLESGKIEIKKEKVIIKDLIDFTLQPLLLQFKNKGVELNVSIEKDVQPVFGNRDHFSTVITNLLNNALKYTDRDGKVNLDVMSEKDNLKISISDTGKGIPLEQQDSIFDKFVQFNRAMDASPGSVGLGLSISKEIVEQYGGKIWVESKIGFGSRFTFLIPFKIY